MVKSATSSSALKSGGDGDSASKYGKSSSMRAVTERRKPGTALVLITLDSESCGECQKFRDEWRMTLESGRLLDAMKAAQMSHPLNLKDCPKWPSLYGFFYENHKLNQCVCPKPIALYHKSEKMRQRLFRRLQHVYHRMNASPTHSDYFERDSDQCIYGKTSKTDYYTIYIILNPFTSKTLAETIAKSLIEYVRQQSPYLFMDPTKW